MRNVATVFFDELRDAAQAESPLPALGAMVPKPSAIRVSADRCGADAQESAHFFEREFRIEKPLDQISAGFFEIAAVVICGHAIVEVLFKKTDDFWQVAPNALRFRVHNARRDRLVFHPPGPGRAQ